MIEQGSDEWKRMRCGKVTASRVADVIAKIKSGGWGASRANYMAELIVERLTEIPTEGFVSAEMKWGKEKEPEARAAYEFLANVDVELIDFVDHPEIEMSGASPDGFVGADGLVEFKCPSTATHIETLLAGAVPGKYITQIHWQFACCPGRMWCDYVSFDPRMPAELQFFKRKIVRDHTMVAELETAVVNFIMELDNKIDALKSLYAVKDAA